MNRVFETEAIESVNHFAALKAVGESSRFPLAYYDKNISGTLALLEVMAAHGCNNMIFSSSATVLIGVVEDKLLPRESPRGSLSLRFYDF